MLVEHGEAGACGEMGLEGPGPGASCACRHRSLPGEDGAVEAVSFHATSTTS